MMYLIFIWHNIIVYTFFTKSQYIFHISDSRLSKIRQQPIFQYKIKKKSDFLHLIFTFIVYIIHQEAHEHLWENGHPHAYKSVSS